MDALETYKLAQDANKVWNGKKWKAEASYSKFKFNYILVGADILTVSNHKDEKTMQTPSEGRNRFPLLLNF